MELDMGKVLLLIEIIHAAEYGSKQGGGDHEGNKHDLMCHPCKKTSKLIYAEC